MRVSVACIKSMSFSLSLIMSEHKTSFKESFRSFFSRGYENKRHDHPAVEFPYFSRLTE